MDAPPRRHVHGSPSGGVEERARTDVTERRRLSAHEEEAESGAA